MLQLMITPKFALHRSQLAAMNHPEISYRLQNAALDIRDGIFLYYRTTRPQRYVRRGSGTRVESYYDTFAKDEYVQSGLPPRQSLKKVIW